MTARQNFSMVKTTVRFLVMLILFSTDIFSWVYMQLPGSALQRQILLICAYVFAMLLISAPFYYVSQFKIEAKYDMNRCTFKTFVADCIKSFLVSAAIYIFISNGFYVSHESMGSYFVIATGVVSIAFLLFLSMLSSLILRIDNKLTPLEEGSLRSRLTEMFINEGYRLKDIYVMDASRRTTKSNAACMGMGKMKKIVLYDNLVNDYTEDEIIAVFAHELSHFKHHDAEKSTLFSILSVLLINAAISAFFFLPQLSVAYGFAGINAAFAVLTVMESDVLGIINAIIQAIYAAIGRPMEIRADAMATDYGYGKALISFFKKVAQKDLGDLNPHPLIMALEDEHPPVHQRIDAIKARMKNRR